MTVEAAETAALWARGCAQNIIDRADKDRELARVFAAYGEAFMGQAVSQLASPSPSSTAWAWDALGAEVDGESDAYMAAFQDYALVNPNLTTNRWAVATVDAEVDDPTYTIPLAKQGGSITARIPLGARPDPASDGHLTVRDVPAGIETDFWQAEFDAETGRIVGASSAITFPLGNVNTGTLDRLGWPAARASTVASRQTGWLAPGPETPQRRRRGQATAPVQSG